MIDYLLIWKKIHGQLSNVEEKELQEWIASDSKHADYYARTLAYYKSGRDPRLLLKDDALVNLKSGITFKKERDFKIWRYAAVILLLIFSGTILWLSIDNFSSSQLPDEELLTELSKNTGSVQLFTSGGEQINFDKDSAFSIDDEEAAVSALGNKIEYESKGNTKGKSAMNILVIPRGESFNLELADGTKVWLNSESVIKYPSKFADQIREVEFSGEAYFEVAKDANRPFILHSQSQELRVLGTSFNVTSYKDEDRILTTLIEGSVAIQPASGEQLILQPNEQSSLTKATGMIEKRTVEVENFIAWKDGIMHFDNMELHELLGRLSRWYDIKVECENQAIRTKKFTGEIARYDDVSEFLKMLEASGIVEFKLDKNVVTVK
ncbi:FecR family protein [Echinicola vietnamensis]|uniref:Fe2+-dicitrate sensor, membrane component n=1 Tax=Echinicola vietnamensis (strain DSM 17526 / LMG 23754 / KMM 6221) TaxID=926556 RepID=L0G5X4_ECHVK|nr:FecR domain-containing protein [Echinicola vietnamensis]AGA80401.1 Fe2+-dicitrate sensor, membrane component [Echinicola vietnamensis DSM 17526]